MSTELEVVSKAIANINAVSEGLANLTKQYGGVVYEVATTKGMEEAKAARAAIREPRYNVEKVRKEAKAPILALGKKLDSEAARITAELLKIEDPIDAQIKNEEQRKEREREEKIKAEEKRQADLQVRLAELRGNRNLSAMSGSELIADHIGDIERIPVDASFQELEQQAKDAKSAGLAWLRELHASALAHEAEQARIKAEREELARLRAEQEKQQAAERARLAEEERVARAAREAEDRAAREKLAAEQAELNRQRQAEQERIAAENKRLADERAEFEREQAEARRIAEEAERARLAAEAADRQRKEEAAKASRKAKYPGEDAIVDALVQHFGVTAAVVKSWLIELRKAA